MAESLEGRTRRNGAMRSHAKHVREDMKTLRKDMSQLRTDLGALAAMQWNELRERAENSAHYVTEQVRARPMTTLGVAAAAGIVAGIALSAMNGNGHARRR